jgi:hypothetical protein
LQFEKSYLLLPFPIGFFHKTYFAFFGEIHKAYLIDNNFVHTRMSAPCAKKRRKGGQSINYYTNQETEQQIALPTQIKMLPPSVKHQV